MIRTLSPYYINIPWVAPSTNIATRVLIKIYIWNGLKSNVPDNATYEVTKDNALETDQHFKINISNWIKDFIPLDVVSVSDSTSNGNNQWWVKIETIYTTETESDFTNPSNQTIKLFCKGYNYGMEGENAEATEGFLVPILDYKVARNTVFTIPYLIPATELPVPFINLISVTPRNDGSNIYDFTYTKQGDYTTFDLVISFGGVFQVIGNITDTTSGTGFFTTASSVDTVQLFGFDNLTATQVQSNIITL